MLNEGLKHSVEYVKRYLNGPLNHTFEDYVADKEYVAQKQGEKIGEKNGRKQGIIETARNLLKLNMSKEDIMKATGLSEKEIDKLK